MSPNELSSQTTSLKTRFARRFLQSFLRMKKSRPTSSSLKHLHRRSQRIKMASYSSMALAVGSKRAWSRAVILKIRHRGLVRRRLQQSSQCSVLKKKKKKKKKVVEEKRESRDQESRFDKLRELVPGGEKMELCNLLEETAHYINCLGTQVKVMEKMAGALST